MGWEIIVVMKQLEHRDLNQASLGIEPPNRRGILPTRLDPIALTF